MEPELSLLSPPATPPLELNKVSQSIKKNAIVSKNRQKKNCEFDMHDLYDKGYSFLSSQSNAQTHSSGAMK